MTANGVAAWKDLDGDGVATATLNSSGGGSVSGESDVPGLVADLALKAPLASPTFTGTPAAPTAAQGTSTTQLATTAMVQSEVTLLAPKASPTFTGTPSLPTGTTGTTQSAADGSTKLATTAYVDTAGALKANLASPTLTGTPTLPTGTIATTQSAADSSTKLATTAFVTTADNLKANLASPTFTGTVVLPDSTVTSAMITDGAIVNADVNASAGITGEKLTLSSFQPADHGLKFWSFDHTLKTANTVLTSGTLTLIKVKTPTAQTITTVSLGVTTAPTGALTTGQNLIAVCDSTGAQLGSTSADQTTPWATTGLKTATVGSFSTTAGSFVYVILLSVVASLACPAFGSTSAGIAAITNIGLSAAAYRAATNLTTQTTMGGLPLTLANNVSIGTHLWAGLS